MARPPRALPPGAPVSTARMRGLIKAKVRAHTRGVLSAFSRLFKDLDGPAKAPVTHAEKFAAGGAVKIGAAIGEVLHPTELEDWHRRAEFPLIRAEQDAYTVTSGEGILSRALGAGARSVDTVLIADGHMHVLPLRLTPGITRQQVKSAALTIPDPPRVDAIVSAGMNAAVRQNVARANDQVSGLTPDRPFRATEEIREPFTAAARTSARAANREIQAGSDEMVQALSARTTRPRSLRDTDIGHKESDQAEASVRARGDISGRTAARISDQAASDADTNAVRARHESLGIKRYMWVTSRDERVRKRHKELDRTVHRWDDPPVVNPKTGRKCHPGEDFGPCRCTASPLVDDIMSALDELGTAPAPAPEPKPKPKPRPRPKPASEPKPAEDPERAARVAARAKAFELVKARDAEVERSEAARSTDFAKAQPHLTAAQNSFKAGNYADTREALSKSLKEQGLVVRKTGNRLGDRIYVGETAPGSAAHLGWDGEIVLRESELKNPNVIHTLVHEEVHRRGSITPENYRTHSAIEEVSTEMVARRLTGEANSAGWAYHSQIKRTVAALEAVGVHPLQSKLLAEETSIRFKSTNVETNDLTDLWIQQTKLPQEQRTALRTHLDKAQEIHNAGK